MSSRTFVFQGPAPEIVTLCGSTRFGLDAFVAANLRLTLAGRVVLSIGCDTKTDDDLFGRLPYERQKTVKHELDELHLRKIDMSDWVLVLNVNGYIGQSTRGEIDYAEMVGRPVHYLENGHKGCERCALASDSTRFRLI